MCFITDKLDRTRPKTTYHLSLAVGVYYTRHRLSMLINNLSATVKGCVMQATVFTAFEYARNVLFSVSNCLLGCQREYLNDHTPCITRLADTHLPAWAGRTIATPMIHPRKKTQMRAV